MLNQDLNLSAEETKQLEEIKNSIAKIKGCTIVNEEKSVLTATYVTPNRNLRLRLFHGNKAECDSFQAKVPPRRHTWDTLSNFFINQIKPIKKK